MGLVERSSGDEGELMRIALYHNLPSGGARRVAYEHCQRLVAAGHEVVVYQPGTGQADRCDLAEVATAEITLPFSLRSAGRGVGGLGRTVSQVRLALGYGRLERLQWQVAAAIHAGGFDLLYAHHDMFETAPTLLRLVHLPSVYFCQEPFRGAFEAPLVTEGEPVGHGGSTLGLLARSLFPNPIAETMKRYRRLNERVNTLAATVVLANSSYSCESIMRAHGCVARRCTLGVDVDFFTPGDAKQDYVLSVGAFHPLKGFRFLLRALAALPPEQRPPLKIAGDRAEPGEQEHLRRLAQELGVELTTHLAVGDEELRELYRGARVFLYAPYLEPLGLTPLEAMACGTAVLGVREGGVRETVAEGRTGRLADRDEALYAQELAELLADPAETARLAAAGPQYVRENWTWDKSVAELLGHFARARGAQPAETSTQSNV
jgi:glycosyltransferase involved in cell wall biosynthesis